MVDCGHVDIVAAVREDRLRGLILASFLAAAWKLKGFLGLISAHATKVSLRCTDAMSDQRSRANGGCAHRRGVVHDPSAERMVEAPKVPRQTWSTPRLERQPIWREPWLGPNLILRREQVRLRRSDARGWIRRADVGRTLGVPHRGVLRSTHVAPIATLGWRPPGPDRRHNPPQGSPDPRRVQPSRQGRRARPAGGVGHCP